MADQLAQAGQAGQQPQPSRRRRQQLELAGDRLHLGQAKSHPWPMPGQGSHRIGDRFLLQAGRCHLVEERLEQVVVVPVHQGDIKPMARHHAGGAKAAEPHADDDNPLFERLFLQH